MHHLATLTVGPFQASGKPYRVQCACGTTGDFNLEVQAVQFFNLHVSRIGPTETSALVVPGAAPPPPPPAPDSKESAT